MNKNETTAMKPQVTPPSGRRESSVGCDDCRFIGTEESRLRVQAGGGRYFTLKELTHSDTAVGLHIDNTPSPVQERCLTLLVNHVLDPIREHWGLPILVTSGYRCPELNEEVGGVEDSYHMDGCAADITANGPDDEFRRHRNIELMSLIRALHLTGRICLTECYAGPDYKYIHVAYSSSVIDPQPFI